jgi:hypothetical protein
VRAVSSAFCAEVLTGRQWLCFNDSIQSHYCISSKTHAILDKAAVIHEILNIWMTNGWSVKSGWQENTSFITSNSHAWRGGVLIWDFVNK